MLNKFNNLVKNLLFEQADNTESEKRIKNTYNTNEFYLKILKPHSQDLEIFLTKQRNNTFLVIGPLPQLVKFFNTLKVDETFMDNPKEFKIYSPCISFGDRMVKLKLDQFFPIQHDIIYGVPTTHELENSTGNVLEGQWFELHGEDDKPVKSIKPSELEKKFFNKVFFRSDKKYMNEIPLYFEFQVNTEDWNNQVWGEMSEWAKDPDEMNDLHNSDFEEFDYDRLNNK